MEGIKFKDSLSRSWQNTAVDFYNFAAVGEDTSKVNNRFIKSYSRLGRLLNLTGNELVLDMGCGLGRITGSLKQVCKRVVGLDVSDTSLSCANSRYPDDFFVLASMEMMPFKPKVFDVAIAMTSLEHCYEKDKVLIQIKNLLKENGLLFIEVRNNDFILFKLARLLRIDRFLNLFTTKYPAESFDDLSFDEWTRLFTENGFVVREVVPSLRPWFTGNIKEKTKNFVIKLCKIFFARRYHYMTGFLLNIDSGTK